jgi:hypothetical protein
VSDSSEEAQQKLAALEAKYADDLTRSEAQFVEVAESLLGQWRTWWRDPEAVSKLAVEARLHNKFLMCFPLAAHAMNHVEAALTARLNFPWVAKTSARIAFEQTGVLNAVGVMQRRAKAFPTRTAGRGTVGPADRGSDAADYEVAADELR